MFEVTVKKVGGGLVCMFDEFVTLNVAGDTSTLYICINVSVSVTCHGMHVSIPAT